MSKTVKEMIMREYTARVGDHKDALILSIRGVKGTDTTRLRNGLAKKNIRITVVRNSLARKTFGGGPLAGLSEFMSGASALAYGGQSVVEVAREVVGLMATFKGLELKGAILDGQLFKGKEGVEELSRFPTKDEAIGRVVTLIISPGQKILAQVNGPGAGIAGIIKAIETKLEKGEAIAAKA